MDANVLFDIINVGCVDDPNGYEGYDCSQYEKYCSDSYIQWMGNHGVGNDWYRRFRAACKSTCSRFASSYCTAVTCKGKNYKTNYFRSYFYESFNCGIEMQFTLYF